ncbi:hypothetical protein [Natrinema hispanicum]|uniref:hypothetical protein n=1 Tax=Natrinema hispanicum TaxID=392421 RepID=UPI000A86864A|nr:hypothetical protein [Natrinema hispanicum]
MSSTAEFTLIATIVIQFLLAGIVYVDMRQFNLDEFQRYDLAILVPLGGFLVFPYYTLKRAKFTKSKQDSSSYIRITKSELTSIRTKLFILALMTGVPFKMAGSQTPGSASQLALLTISGISTLFLFRVLRQYQSE